MEVCRNKESRKYFIYLGSIRHTKNHRFINPAPRIVALPLSQFEDFIDEEEASLIAKGVITHEQLALYRENENNEETQDLDRMLIEFEELSPDAQIRILESLKKKIKKDKAT